MHRAASPVSLREQEQTFDYVIIVPDNTFTASLNPLVVWKQQIGFHVKVETLTNIISLYPGGADDAERIWLYLHDRYPPLKWGIRYVLLVGDIDRIPMRYLFTAPGEGAAYGTDYYYANLDVSDWDLDNDLRWGEFEDDRLDLHAEVLVGRLPFNNPAAVLTFANNVVAYEQSIAGWKRQGLLVHGIWDYVNMNSKTDAANLAEMLRTNLFTPYGWTTTRLYEQDGISPSTYTSEGDVDQAVYDALLSSSDYGVINIAMHGTQGGGSMQSFTWLVDANNNNVWDSTAPTTEFGSSLVSDEANIPTNPTRAVVFLLGCETGLVMLNNPAVTTVPSSLFINTLTNPDMMVKEYLANGSPAVIGSTAGMDYGHLWSKLSDQKGQTLNYFFYRNLIEKDLPVGDAFYAALEEHARQFSPHRGIRVFNYFGDPSLLQKGIEDHPGGADRLIWEGAYKDLAADYDENGALYVGLAYDNLGGTSSTIQIQRSTNHGQSWTGWTSVEVPAPASLVRDLSLVVGRLTEGTSYLHVLYALTDGRVYDTRLALANPDFRGTVLIAGLEKLPRFLAAARTPGTGLSKMYIYAAWEYAYVSDSDPALAVYRSGDNGATWVRMANWDGLQQPSIAAGPAGAVHLAAVQPNDPGQPGSLNEVVALRSTDYAANWSAPLVLTENDGALGHVAPDIAASTDPAYPAVWIAYEYDLQDPAWSSTKDLRFAYSGDNGSSWTRDRSLAADPSRDEWLPDLAGVHAANNRWVNLAYSRDKATAAGHERQVIWRYTSGGRPNYWNPPRIVNDYPGGAPYASAALVLYSPGAAGSGSGVVYGGPNRENIYFSAPWLAAAAGAPEMASQPGFAATRSTDWLGPLSSRIGLPAPATPSSLPPTWHTLAHIPNASSVSGLVVGSDGALYAASVLDRRVLGAVTGHTARVYRSDNRGQSWAPTAAFDNSWSVSSLIRTPANTLLAAGMALSSASASQPGVNPQAAAPQGVIYRSVNHGQSWNTVYQVPNMAVYRLEKDSHGTLYAGTGWNGKLLHSTDDGLSWPQLADFGAGAVVHDVLRTSSGRLVVALEKPTGGEVRSTSNPASGWTTATGLPGALSINDLLEVDGVLYAAARTTTGGQVFQSDLSGLSWSNPATVSPAAASITRLYLGARNQLLAGVENTPGASVTGVYRLNPAAHTWAPYNGWMDMATVVYELLHTDEGLFAATGYRNGNVYRVLPDYLFWLYFPTIRR